MRRMRAPRRSQHRSTVRQGEARGGSQRGSGAPSALQVPLAGAAPVPAREAHPETALPHERTRRIELTADLVLEVTARPDGSARLSIVDVREYANADDDTSVELGAAQVAQLREVLAGCSIARG